MKKKRLNDGETTSRKKPFRANLREEFAKTMLPRKSAKGGVKSGRKGPKPPNKIAATFLDEVRKHFPTIGQELWKARNAGVSSASMPNETNASPNPAQQAAQPLDDRTVDPVGSLAEAQDNFYDYQVAEGLDIMRSGRGIESAADQQNVDMARSELGISPMPQWETGALDTTPVQGMEPDPPVSFNEPLDIGQANADWFCPGSAELPGGFLGYDGASPPYSDPMNNFGMNDPLGGVQTPDFSPLPPEAFDHNLAGTMDPLGGTPQDDTPGTAPGFKGMM